VLSQSGHVKQLILDLKSPNTSTFESSKQEKALSILFMVSSMLITLLDYFAEMVLKNWCPMLLFTSCYAGIFYNQCMKLGYSGKLSSHLIPGITK